LPPFQLSPSSSAFLSTLLTVEDHAGRPVVDSELVEGKFVSGIEGVTGFLNVEACPFLH